MSFPTLVSGQDEYPTNFDCEYQVTAPRTEGSCYEIHIEHPFSLETSRSCRNDRLEIFNILNAADISMDPAADDTTAVLCGNGMFYILESQTGNPSCPIALRIIKIIAFIFESHFRTCFLGNQCNRKAKLFCQSRFGDFGYNLNYGSNSFSNI